MYKAIDWSNASSLLPARKVNSASKTLSSPKFTVLVIAVALSTSKVPTEAATADIKLPFTGNDPVTAAAEEVIWAAPAIPKP